MYHRMYDYIQNEEFIENARFLFRKDVPYCLLQHIPWIYITLTYWIHVEPATYAKAKR